jgi:hypothetical protein
MPERCVTSAVECAVWHRRLQENGAYADNAGGITRTSQKNNENPSRGKHHAALVDETGRRQDCGSAVAQRCRGHAPPSWNPVTVRRPWKHPKEALAPWPLLKSNEKNTEEKNAHARAHAVRASRVTSRISLLSPSLSITFLIICAHRHKHAIRSSTLTGSGCSDRDSCQVRGREGTMLSHAQQPPTYASPDLTGRTRECHGQHVARTDYLGSSAVGGVAQGERNSGHISHQRAIGMSCQHRAGRQTWMAECATKQAGHEASHSNG